MATKTKTEQKYTLAEAEAELKKRKQSVREAREALKRKKGFCLGLREEKDEVYNRLAVGLLSDGKGHLIRCTATMENAEGGVIVNAYPHGIFHRGCFARGASVDAAADAMASMLTDLAEAWLATGKGSLREGLSREYVKNAKTHTYNPPKE